MSQPAMATSSASRAPKQAATARPLVLVVDDETAMQRFLGAILGDSGFRVTQAATGADAVEVASTEDPDLVLLDLGLPDFSGMEVTRRLRQWYSAPILIVSARGQENDKIDALDAGANDYVTKPFGPGELLARLRVWLRQASVANADGPSSVIDVGDLRVDLSRRLVFAAGHEVHLTPTEYKLFAMLMRNAGRVITHRQLLEEAWGPPYANETQYLRVYMAALRRKLEKDSARPCYLVSEPGVGYRLKAP